ncbi:hypothetical protein N7481_002576 [Penicillium waksmanii]|uniref:uncharacterized protein n=1 Tax=Penicillium waksmanii TaxID=69791 RepID=UPI0025467F6D|nr:uncharacterized protein N7481_002576 [Penicillium waksmanii]KAJ5995599.1 hypothetical protein N7481_002576 [Penicillium waksmanii]
MEQQQRKSDCKTSPRSQHGCTNCRRSKVKCDEHKPICTRCWQKDLQCSSNFQLKWESNYRDRGVAFGRSGLWGKNTPKNRQTPTRSTESGSAFQEETTWLATPTIQPWTFLNNDVSLIRRLYDEEQGHTKRQLLPAFDVKLAIGEQGPREPFLSTSRSSSPSSLSKGIDRAPVQTLPSSLSIFPSLDEIGNRSLFDYYINHICPRTVHSPLSQSPFASVILPYCASATPTVLRAIQALAACHWAQYDPQYTNISLQLKSRVLREFRKRISVDRGALLASDPEILVIVMFLCMFDIVDYCNSQWIVHLQGAKDIIRLRRRQLQISTGGNGDPQQDEVSSFVELFFAFQDVMGRTACAKADLFGPRYWDETDTTINPWMGCSPALVSILFSVMDLSRSRQRMLLSDDQMTFETRAATLKNRLEELEQQPCTKESDQTIPRIAEVKKLTCIVFLKCALYGGRPSDPEIKTLVRKIMMEIQELLALEAVCQLIWPLFVAAVELDPLDIELLSNPESGLLTNGRRLVLELLESMAMSSVSSVHRTRVVIEQVWNSRDFSISKSSEPVRASTLDLNDWEQYVVPVSDALSLV